MKNRGNLRKLWKSNATVKIAGRRNCYWSPACPAAKLEHSFQLATLTLQSSAKRASGTHHLFGSALMHCCISVGGRRIVTISRHPPIDRARPLDRQRRVCGSSRAPSTKDPCTVIYDVHCAGSICNLHRFPRKGQWVFFKTSNIPITYLIRFRGSRRLSKFPRRSDTPAAFRHS